jgi:hypothetical protein
MSETELLYRFLNHIISIEAMLSEGIEITEKVSRRLAVLVSSRFQNMQETFEKFKNHYDIRSRILLGGKIPELTPQAVDFVSELAQTAIRNYLLLRKKYSGGEVKSKLDKFFDNDVLKEIQQITAL